MKRTLKLLGAAIVAAAWTGVVLAGNYTNNFDLGDPTTNTTATGFLIKANTARLGFSPLWVPYNGDPILTYQGGVADTNANLGFVAMVDGQGGENFEMVFPDIDLLTNIDNTTTPPTTNTFSLPVQGLTLDMDLRVGNGTTARPADGFSISYARSGDPVLVNATNGVVNGFAGGDGSVAAAQNPAGSGDVENGTKTGVAVVFDAWFGNFLPDTPIRASDNAGDAPAGGANDSEGVEVRVDDVTLFQSDLSLNRNIGCQSNVTLTLANISEQTGPTDAGVSTYTNLCWQHLHVGLTNAHITVSWKGFTVLNNFSLSGYSATQGRLVFAARTGGANQNVDVDNIHLITSPINNPFIQTASGLANGCIVTLFDVGAAVTTNLLFVGLDTNTPALATNVTAFSTMTNEGGTFPGGPHHYIVVNLPYRLAPNSKHLVSAVWLDSVNGTTNDIGTIQFTVPNYLAFPTNFALPLASVDTNQPGFVVRSYQSLNHISPGTVSWSEELAEGLHGPNNAAQNSSGAIAAFVPNFFPDGSGAFTYSGAINLDNLGDVSPTDPGLFGAPQWTETDFNSFGIANNLDQANYNNATLEMSAYVSFPTSGVYTVVIGADAANDGYRVSVGANPFERIGFTAAFSVNSGSARLPGQTGPTTADYKFFLIDRPGVYPVRIFWDSRNADPSGLEIYQVFPPSTGVGGTNVVNQYVLMNDTNTAAEGLPNSILAYQALVGSVPDRPFIAKANPVNNSADVLFYQPVVVTLQDGGLTANSTNGLTVNAGSVTMVTDGTNSQAISSVKTAGLTQVVQQHSATWTNWTFGTHSIALSFNDNLGTNYSYTWSFTINPNVNPTNVTQIPGAFAVNTNTLDFTQPGFRIRSFQQFARNQGNQQGFTEEAIEGLRGVNLADQSGTGGNGYYSVPGFLDYNLPAQTGPAGEYNVDHPLWSGTRGSPGGFGFGVNLPARTPAADLADDMQLDIEGWVVFPSAGFYAFLFNSDDGDTIMMPLANSLTNKAALQLAISDVGRGSAGPAQPVGGTYAVINIPQAGAYPLRILYENGSGGANLEFSAYNVLADGSVVKTPVNDTTDPNSLQVFQVSSAPVGPSITYMNPVRNAVDVLFNQANVVKIADGASTLVSASVSLKTDGVADSISLSKSGGVTTILQNMGSSIWSQSAHTNILLYSDNLGNSYSNWWRFTVVTRPDFIGNAEMSAPFTVPASARINPATLDLTQPGFRIKAYYTTAATAGNVQWTEEQFQGLHGPNIAVPPTNGLPYFAWNNVIDWNITGSTGDYWYDFDVITNSAFAPNGGLGGFLIGTSTTINNYSLIIGTYLNFPTAGTYTMAMNTDDGFKVSIPDGGTNASYWSQAGSVIGWFDGGRGSNNGHSNPGPGNGRTLFSFTIPQAGAYPFRFLYENGSGGPGCVEWEIFQTLPDGSTEEILLGDTNCLVTAYQALVTPAGPTVLAVNPIPGVVVGLNTPAMTLQSGAINEQDMTIALQDAATTVNTNTITLTFNGVAQPIVIATNGAGITTVFRSGTNFWPSGAIGQLVVSYQDNLGTSYSQVIATVATTMWGTLTGGYPTGSGDATKPGFLARTWQLDQTGSTGTPGDLPSNEQILAGLWTNNVANLTNATDIGPNGLGYYVLQGTGPVNGVINFATGASGVYNNQGDFQPNNGYPEAAYSLVGIPGHTTGATGGQSFVTEYLTYIDFPAAGTYYMGVNSDDGFIVTRGWGAPNDNGALMVNSPASLAGPKAAAPSSYPGSQQVTNFITGNLVLALGAGEGSTNNNEGCIITNVTALNNNIALIYDTLGSTGAGCSSQEKVQNALAAGARAVVFVRNTPLPLGNGFMPNEPGVNQPQLPIPTIRIKLEDANPLVAAMATNTVSVTLTPYDFLVNPPAAQSPLGMANFGKGGSDIDFPVVVPQAGVFPIRLLHFANPGGNEVEFYSVGTNNTQRTLINDSTATNGLPALHAYWGVTMKPSIALTVNGSSITVTNNGTLQMSTDLTHWTDVYGDGPVTTLPTSGTQKFFRAR